MRDYEIMCSVTCRKVTQGIKYLMKMRERKTERKKPQGSWAVHET